MRPQIVIVIAFTLSCLPAWAQDVPADVDPLLTCGNTFAMQAEDLRAKGDEGGATEALNMSGALIGQAQASMEAAGMDAAAIQNVSDNAAMITGFRYGAGESETLIAECLAAADSP